jgi:hypothetical protein
MATTSRKRLYACFHKGWVEVREGTKPPVVKIGSLVRKVKRRFDRDGFSTSPQKVDFIEFKGGSVKTSIWNRKWAQMFGIRSIMPSGTVLNLGALEKKRLGL